jgi:hypothetical protein
MSLLNRFASLPQQFGKQFIKFSSNVQGKPSVGREMAQGLGITTAILGSFGIAVSIQNRVQMGSRKKQIKK